MDRPNTAETSAGQAAAFLSEHLPSPATDVAFIGAGAWSRCFGFRQGDDDLVVRFGSHLEDFDKDQRAAGFAREGLPVPRVLEVGRAFDGYFAISTRVHGVPLESVDAATWRTIVPSLAAAMEAMRTLDPGPARGFGLWGADGDAAAESWSGYLLEAASDAPERRTHGWRKLIARSAVGEGTFLRGLGLLQDLDIDDVPRSLVHADLINRNVLVGDGEITGIFDWGCSLYGDHLYELAWFEFWSPWYPNLDLSLLRAELERRWAASGYLPKAREQRLMACYLHIGLDHLAYNAFIGDETNLIATAARMMSLVDGLS